MVVDGGLRCVRPAARADDGRDVGQRDPRALARQAARRQRRRLVRGAAGRRRDEGAGRRGRGRGADRRARRLAEPGVAARMGDAARAYVRAEHDLGRVAEPYVSALEQAAGSQRRRGEDPRRRRRGGGRHGRRPGPARAGARASSASSSPNGHVPVSDTRTGLLRTWPMWAWLGALYAVAVAVQLALALRVTSPWIMVDELVYSDMARSFADTGHFLIRGAHANYGFVYPLLLSPAYALFGSVADVYQWARLFNALVDVLGRLPGLSARAARRAAGIRACGGGARGRDPADGLRRHADDGERVLSGLRLARVRARARARAADAASGS